MDVNDFQLAVTSPSLSNEDLNVEYTFASPRPQRFSLPYPIIKYMFTNPSSAKAWKKLIMTCKYFFSKNPVFPVECLICVSNKKWKADAEIFDSTKTIAKLWIYDEIDANEYDAAPTLLSSLIPKISKCNLSSLDIWYQYLSFEEYQFLTASGDLKQLRLKCGTISHPDGTLVTFDQLFINIPKLESFYLYCAANYSSMFQPDTFQKFAEIFPCLKELSYFAIHGLTDDFDFASITDFLMKNEKLVIYLSYSFPLSAGYEEILKKFITKLIETPPKRIPIISFCGFQNSALFNDYQKLRRS